MTESTLTRRGQKLRVMVVEDHALIALDLKLMIDELGGEVVSMIASGEEAETRVRELHPDVVLMDIHLAGEMDGIDAAKAVTKVPGTAVIFVTGNTDPLTLNRIRRFGDFRIVPKPVLPDDLAAAIRHSCGLDVAPLPCAAAVWQVSALPRHARRPRPKPRPRATIRQTSHTAIAAQAGELMQACVTAQLESYELSLTLQARIEALHAVQRDVPVERRR